jgi:hypothetical protein
MEQAFLAMSIVFISLSSSVAFALLASATRKGGRH